MIVENLFEKNFGNTISNFCLQNNRQDGSKANYSSVLAFADTLDQLMNLQKQENSAHRESKKELPVLARSKNLFSSKEINLVGLK
jgi:hypothetical protein